MARIGVIGGGPAGLGVAYDLAAQGHGVTLFEADDALGGLARSFEFGDIRIERYYHFICADDHEYFRRLDELGLSGAIRWRPTRMGFYYDGRLFPFSSGFDLLRFDAVPLSGRLRYGAHVLYCALTKSWQALDHRSASSWLRQALGTEMYRATWYPLLNVKFHGYHEQISAAWVWHRVHRVANSRKTLLHKEQLGYLTGGTDVLVDRLCAGIRQRGGELKTSVRVERVEVKGGRVTGIVANGVHHDFDYVVSAVPLPVYLKLTPGLPDVYRDDLQKISFLGVVCVLLHLKHRISDNYWLNVNDPRVPFNGCIEYTNLNDEATRDGTSLLYIPFYLPTTAARYKQPDEETIAECLQALKIVNPAFRDDWVIRASVGRDPYAQVVCTTDFALRVPPHQTPVEGLYLIESSQLYPSDRTISGTLELARNVSTLIRDRESRKRASA